MWFDKIQLSQHAKEQIRSRSHGDIIDRWGTVVGHAQNIVDEHSVLEAVNSKADQIRSARVPEVRVVVRRFNAVIQAPDGSNGDLLVACVDPERRKVKTVMLQRKHQASFEDKRQVQYLNLDML